MIRKSDVCNGSDITEKNEFLPITRSTKALVSNLSTFETASPSKIAISPEKNGIPVNLTGDVQDIEMKNASPVSASNCSESESDCEPDKEEQFLNIVTALLFPCNNSSHEKAKQRLNIIKESISFSNKGSAKWFRLLCSTVFRAMEQNFDNIHVLDRAFLVLSSVCINNEYAQNALTKTEGIALIVKAMAKHNISHTIQKQGVSTLLALSTHKIARQQIINERGAECVTWAMMDFPDDISLQKNCAACLCNLSYTSETNKRRIGKVGGINAIANAMYKFKNDAELQARACLAIRNLTFGQRTNQWIAGKCCAVEAISPYMKAHKHDTEVQHQTCVTIANLCAQEPDNRARVTELGIVPLVINLLEKNMEDELIVEHCLSFFHHVAICNAENQEQIGAEGGLPLILQSLKRFRTSKKVVVMGASALRYMMFSRRNRRLMLEYGGLEVLVRMVRDGAEIAEVSQATVCTLANSLYDSEESKLVVARYGGIAGLVDVMQNHLDSEEIQEHGCRALRNLADSDELNTRLVAASGGLGSVILAMMGYEKNARIVEEGCAMLFNMAFRKEYVREMKRLGVVQVVETGRLCHKDNIALQYQALALMEHIQSPLDKLRLKHARGGRECSMKT